VGYVLDLAGGNSVLGWALAFGDLAPVTLAGLFILRRLGTRGRQPATSSALGDLRVVDR
jgi:hypothetical protein